jgi:hypothetical protein
MEDISSFIFGISINFFDAQHKTLRSSEACIRSVNECVYEEDSKMFIIDTYYDVACEIHKAKFAITGEFGINFELDVPIVIGNSRTYTIFAATSFIPTSVIHDAIAHKKTTLEFIAFLKHREQTERNKILVTCDVVYEKKVCFISHIRFHINVDIADYILRFNKKFSLQMKM